MAKKRKKSGEQPSKAAAPAPAEESRGKQRRREAQAERAKLERAAAETTALGPVAEPAFWFGFDVTWAKLALGRFVVFALLAVDALLQISHAPRYGAGGFNVAQLPLLDAIAPTRPGYAIGQLVCAYLFIVIACGVATRIALPVVTVIYGWLYFGSHLDSYQHHYLVWLVLVVACFAPWERPDDATPTTRVRSWALRLILVQLALLYFWAAVSKLNPAWLDGRTLAQQITGGMRSLIDGTVGFKTASWLVILVELALAATVWSRRTWAIAAPLGLALHLGIVNTGLEIGLFAWLMIGLYIFIVPDRIWIWIAERRPIEVARGIAGVLGEWFAGGARWLIWVLAAGIGIALAAASRFDYALTVGVVLLGVFLAATPATLALAPRRSLAWIATAHLLAFVAWTTVDRATDTASDYYRFWGGSSRRLGDLKMAETAYRKMIEVAPNEGGGYFQLGRLLLARDAGEEGLAALRTAQSLEPMKARAYVAEARWLATHGQRDAAIAKAREATIVEPGDAEARSLLDSLQGSSR